MTRIEVIDRAEMNDEQGRAFDDVSAAGGPTGGPYWAYIRQPEVMRQAWELSRCLREAPLTGRERQIAILAVARHWGAKYPWAVQVRASLAAGVDQATIDAINARQEPEAERCPREISLRGCRGTARRSRSERCDL